MVLSCVQPDLIADLDINWKFVVMINLCLQVLLLLLALKLLDLALNVAQHRLHSTQSTGRGDVIVPLLLCTGDR